MCDHEKFEADVIVMKVEDKNSYAAQIAVRCQACGIPFEFIGLQRGTPELVLPHASVNGVLAIMPLKPVERIIREDTTGLYPELGRKSRAA